MNKVISLLAILSFTSPAFADYGNESYINYGYAAGASTINGTELKTGSRASKADTVRHNESLYYPGRHAIAPSKDK